MLDQAYRLVRATAAVAQGVSQQVCKVLPEDSVIVLERANDDGKTVNVRCGTEKLWMFARDLDGALQKSFPDRNRITSSGGECT